MGGKIHQVCRGEIMTIRRALETIKGYWGKHLHCYDCPLSNYGEGYCFIAETIPADWNVEEAFKKRKGESG